MTEDLQFRWVVENEGLERYSRFFVENVDKKYISFGEYQAGLALPGKGWLPDWEEKMLSQLKAIVANSREQAPRSLLAEGVTVEAGVRKLQALAIVRFQLETDFAYAVLEDIVVSKTKATRGTGTRFLGWLEDECRNRKAKYLSLETGVTNRQAARFFRRHGYRPASIVRMKPL